MWAQTKLIQLFRQDGDPSLINRGVQISLTTKASRRSRGSNEIEDGFITIQGMTSPVGTVESRKVVPRYCLEKSCRFVDGLAPESDRRWQISGSNA